MDFGEQLERLDGEADAESAALMRADAQAAQVSALIANALRDAASYVIRRKVSTPTPNKWILPSAHLVLHADGHLAALRPDWSEYNISHAPRDLVRILSAGVHFARYSGRVPGNIDTKLAVSDDGQAYVLTHTVDDTSACWVASRLDETLIDAIQRLLRERRHI
ncbi:MAG: hypothetical protein QOD58_3990 [Mycobacterium sp.]|nr:hypothetical protein [Mycobacterium sp.]